ncbi:hypothetical protein OG819_48155 [Streptomyces sp. NBC_01549]|uniref:hypothetical protein n=1 Tax=unclassified Streptomyces TaxID=2593676 RepID=UPI00225A6DC8|nr:hypothetical protein [Streptomyces sp. NBC_01549]MCX4597120.1 hypothetical protein [Streptomyces sp. NBC_01549]
MNRPYGGVRSRVAALAAAGLLLAGCSGGGPDDGDSAASPAPAESTVSATGSPAVGTSSSARSTPPPPYPTDAAGCHRDRGWSDLRAAAWVENLQLGSPTGTWGDVPFNKALTGFNGPLCDSVTVQVQYWRITYRSIGAGASDPGHYAFSLAPQWRGHIGLDGRAVKHLHAPKKTGSVEPSACVGYLRAVYTGAALTDRELPSEIDSGGLIGQSVSFPTKRVAESQVLEPTAPQTCDRFGHPVTPPSPGAGIPGLPGAAPTSIPPLMPKS